MNSFDQFARTRSGLWVACSAVIPNKNINGAASTEFTVPFSFNLHMYRTSAFRVHKLFIIIYACGVRLRTIGVASTNQFHSHLCKRAQNLAPESGSRIDIKKVLTGFRQLLMDHQSIRGPGVPQIRIGFNWMQRQELLSKWIFAANWGKFNLLVEPSNIDKFHASKRTDFGCVNLCSIPSVRMCVREFEVCGCLCNAFFIFAAAFCCGTRNWWAAMPIDITSTVCFSSFARNENGEFQSEIDLIELPIIAFGQRSIARGKCVLFGDNYVFDEARIVYSIRVYPEHSGCIFGMWTRNECNFKVSAALRRFQMLAKFLAKTTQAGFGAFFLHYFRFVLCHDRLSLLSTKWISN